MRAWGVELRWIVLGAALLAMDGARAAHPDSIAIFRDWGAFREGAADAPRRCYAIAQSPPGTRAASQGAFASVGDWPQRRVRNQIAIRMSRSVPDDAPVTLSIGDMSFALVARGDRAWARDRREDARIVRAMRSGSSMSISAVSGAGRPFADVYRLRGAASAIDAAALACPLGKGG